MPSRIRFIFTILLVFSLQFFALLPVAASTRDFDPNHIITDQELTLMPTALDTVQEIQSYLESEGSVLAEYQVPISFEPDDIIMSEDYFQGLPSYLQPRLVLQPYYNQTMLVSELIWHLSREDIGNGCSFSNYDMCINNRVQPLNPVFILAKIQKEQGLVRGICAQAGAECYGKSMQERLDRAAGYMCTGGAASSSCFDENPNWKYFQGFFRQVYYAIRLLRIYQQRCDAQGVSVGGRVHQTGNSYTYSAYPNNPIETTVTYQNSMTCALYVYTPYVYAQELFFDVLNAMGFNQSLVIPLPEGEFIIPVPDTDAD